MKSSVFHLLCATSILLSACGGGGDSLEEGAVAPDPAASAPSPPAAPPPAVSPSTPANTITSARLSTCSEEEFVDRVSGNASARYQCLTGKAYGFKLPALVEPCILTVAIDGKLALETGGMKYETAPLYAMQMYGKEAVNGMFYLFTEGPLKDAINISAGGPRAGAGDIFTGAGGALAAAYQRFSGDSGFTCLFEIK